jgi:EAL domain-containing protein (putative c-di-GMP-specific phosphodiesterase class I)
VQEDDDKLLVRIGWSVVIEAARRAGEWRRAYPEHPITVSVNLSAGHLSSRDLSSRVEHLLHDNEVPGDHALAFEISERQLMKHRLRARDRLLPLRNLGVEVIVDDFGASAAAGDLDAAELRDGTLEVFESLRGFPLDAVKLDPGFRRRLGEFTPEVVGAAHAADLRVVVVSVEDEAAAHAAIDAGFDLAQGFFFHRPERPAYVDGLLASR